MSTAIVPTDLYIQIQQLLYREARLLSAQDYDAWLDLLDDDIQYTMTVPQQRYRKDIGNDRAPLETPIFNDTKDVLRMRIDRFKTGYVWAENPKNAIRHIISNIEVFKVNDIDKLEVYSVIEVHRSRFGAERKRHIAARKDLWIQQQQEYILRERQITMDDAVVLDSNMNFFF